MAVQERLYTAQELWERSHQGGEAKVGAGEIVEMAPTLGGCMVTMELAG
ncbi:MAG: hypothetical protein LC114_20775 [Bryobacterales bacterium]|nr:hypothetical protein [Bryobacterales bacterium]